MKYAREIIEFMAAYPGRPFKMRELINVVRTKDLSASERHAVRTQVARVVSSLVENESIRVVRSLKGERGTHEYKWIA